MPFILPQHQSSAAGPPQRPPGLSVAAAADGDAYVLTLTGEVDMATVHRLRRGLGAGEQDGAGRIVVDLGRLGFIDSSAVHELLALRDRLRRSDRRLVLLPGPPQVQRVLDICDLGGEVALPG